MTSSPSKPEKLRNPRRGDIFADQLARWKSHQPGARTLIMGVINATPDSFSDGGLLTTSEEAILHGKLLSDEGADILDVGGESTRPGGIAVSASLECERIIPVIEHLAGEGKALSVDTIKPEVADKALQAGASIVNDVRGLQGDRDMADIVGAHGAGLVIMHNPGLFGGSEGTEGDPVTACLSFFEKSLKHAARSGIAEDRIALDPGFGFGKTVEQNIELLARLSELHALGYPLLVGTSRKSFIGKLIDRPVDERLFGSLATNVVAALAGAAIVRVHDVGAHSDALTITAAIASAAATKIGDPND